MINFKAWLKNNPSVTFPLLKESKPPREPLINS